MSASALSRASQMREAVSSKRKRFSLLSEHGRQARAINTFFQSSSSEGDLSSAESAWSELMSSTCSSGYSGESDHEPPAKRSHDDVAAELNRPAYFVGTTSSVADFVQSVNETSRCATDGCKGTLVLKRVEAAGLGGALRCWFACDGCTQRCLPFNSTIAVEHSRRTRVSLALQVASVVSGGGYALYQRLFGQCLGLSTVCKTSFATIVHLLHPKVEEILKGQIELALRDMASIDQTTLGSKARAVTTAFRLSKARFLKEERATVRTVRSHGTWTIIAILPCTLAQG